MGKYATRNHRPIIRVYTCYVSVLKAIKVFWVCWSGRALAMVHGLYMTALNASEIMRASKAFHVVLIQTDPCLA
jgi:hypothetical protein